MTAKEKGRFWHAVKQAERDRERSKRPIRFVDGYGRRVIFRDRFAISQIASGSYEVFWQKRTRFYFAGRITRLKQNCWQISGPRVGIARYGMRTLFSAICEFEREAS